MSREQQAKRARKDLNIQPPTSHRSTRDPKYYRRLKSGQLVCIGERKAYKLAKKALIRESKG